MILSPANMSDETLTCHECGSQFEFTTGEKQFFNAKGLHNYPGRCPSCRAAYKARTGQSVVRPLREMHQVDCSRCGGPAIVPFVPRKEKAVYCSSCFDTVKEEERGCLTVTHNPQSALDL